MKGFTRLAVLAGLLALVLGCATSGPTFSEMKDQRSIAARAPGTGRIFLYRTVVLGAAVQPKIYVNDEHVGKAVAKGFTYVDGPPGNYEVRTSTEVKRTLSMTLEEGETRYVRLNISMGFFVGHVYPELVENDVGEKEIEGLHYLGGS